MSAASLLLTPESYVDPLPLAGMFPRPAPLEIELGAGDGSFLIAWAAIRTEGNFLGVERLLGRIRKIERKARRGGIENVRLLRLEARYTLGYLIPAASARALHVYFPDPWPKKKHRRHRLVDPAFTIAAARVLEPGGHVFLRTDDQDYFAQMCEVFAASPDFHAVETPAELAAVTTDFERTFNARGIPTLRAAYQLKFSGAEAASAR